MQKLIYVPPWDTPGGDDNVSLMLAEPYILGTVSGTSGTDTTIRADTIPGLDGVYMREIRIEPALIKCTVNVHGTNREEMYKNRFSLIQCLTPKADPGTLYYTNDYKTLKIGAVPQNSPQFTARIQNFNTASIEFYCPSPFWEETAATVKKVAYVGSDFSFPLSFEGNIRFGVVQSETIITPKSVVNVPLLITIGAPATNPIKLTNRATGETIELGKALTDGQKLIINTKRGNKSVILVNADGTSEDAFNYITPDSVLFELVPKENNIVYESWNENEPTTVTIEYYERYTGV